MTTVIHYTVPVDHPTFAGHFPGTPILPGVVLLDWALQAITDASGIAMKNCTINSVKFLSPAKPGDALTIALNPADKGAIRFDISTASDKIASGSLVINSAI